LSVGSDPGVAGQRTYLRRRGRMTRGQSRALAELSESYCVASGDELLDPVTVFGRTAPLGIEIGFGMGQSLVEWAVERPHWNLLGLEVYQPGIGSALLAFERHGISSVRLLEAPAERVLTDRLAPGSLDEVRIFFPDPWPKKRHHKRRLLQPRFAALLASRLRPDGVLWIATDWEDYGQWMVDVLDADAGFQRERAPRVGPRPLGGAEQAEHRPRTRFEARGLQLGHQVWDLRYRRKR
jgi:tRNA (guanine-N7-)-methyltransferase